MNAETKIYLIGLCWFVVVVIGLFGIFGLSRPHESSMKLWIPGPKKTSFANMVEGKYTSVEKVSVSGTAIFIPFNQYQERFSYSDHTIIVQENGDVYYLTKAGGETYVSTITKPWSIQDNLMRYRKVTDINLCLGTAIFSYTREWQSVIAASILWLLVTMVIAERKMAKYR